MRGRGTLHEKPTLPFIDGRLLTGQIRLPPKQQFKPSNLL